MTGTYRLKKACRDTVGLWYRATGAYRFADYGDRSLYATRDLGLQ